MILDAATRFSHAQAITGSAASSNVVDLGQASYDNGPGRQQVIVVLVGAAFTLLTSLEFKVQTDDDEAFGSARDLTKLSVELARLTKGAKFTLPLPLEGVERYLRVYYTVTGTNPDAGSVSSFLSDPGFIGSQLRDA